MRGICYRRRVAKLAKHWNSHAIQKNDEAPILLLESGCPTLVKKIFEMCETVQSVKIPNSPLGKR